MKMKQAREQNPEPKTPKETEPQNRHESAIMAAELGGQVPTLDLHGQNADEALLSLENFLFQRHPPGEALRIIHGRGEQILKTAVHKWLKKNTEHVAYFRDSQLPREMGGVTYVVMDL